MTEWIDDKGDEAIRHRAYMIWLDEGQPAGRAEITGIRPLQRSKKKPSEEIGRLSD